MLKKYSIMKPLFLIIFLASATSLLQAQTSQKPKDVKNAPAAKSENTGIPPGSSLLSGIYSALSGTAINLQNNGKIDLVLTAKKETGRLTAPILSTSQPRVWTI